MDYNSLKIIDFSRGIKSDEVMYNDNSLQNQINRERLAVAGSGINYGLEIKLNEFKVSISEGTIIDNEGNEEYIATKTFEVEKPKLIIQEEKLYSESNGIITLSDIPYSNNRIQLSQDCNIEDRGIEVYYEDNLETINISSINSNVLYTNAKDSSRAIIVKYNKTYDRLDTIYIDSNNELQICNGITSSTPSTYIPKDCKYVLAFIKIESKYFDIDEYIARASLIVQYNNRRMVYVDSENNLYLGGIPFESLLKIYLEEPENPKENMLWYNYDTNKLNIWRRTDNFVFTDSYIYTSSNPDNEQAFRTNIGYKKEQLSVYIKDFKLNNDDEDTWTKLTDEELIYYSDLEESEKDIVESHEFRIIPKLLKGNVIKYAVNKYDGSYYWVPINDTSYIAAQEYKIWCPNKDGTGLLNYKQGLNLDELTPERDNHDLQTFLFYKDELNLRFTPYKNELSILIDQIPLYRDQFIEITASDVLNDILLNKYAIEHYKWTKQELQELCDKYKEVGIGFKLLNKLDRPAFIEVDVTHRVNDSILKNKMQRSATFTTEETIIYSSDLKINNEIIIKTKAPYLYGENQLEVFINGVKLNSSKFSEISANNITGENCKSFKINIELIPTDEITYRILTNIYSYDHIYKAIEEENKNLYAKIRNLEKEITAIKSYLNIK